MIQLYHGSYIPIEKPLVNVGRKELDFGPGFYLTRIREQAERWAQRVCVIRNADKPCLSLFSYDESKLPENIQKRLLENYDIEWLDFIADSRKGNMPWKGYDIIEGGVANDQVIDTVEDYYSGRITADQAIGQLKFAKPSNQICISNQSIIDTCLHFEGSILLEKKGGSK